MDEDKGKVSFQRGKKNIGNILDHKIRIVYTNPTQKNEPPEPLGYLIIQASLSGVLIKLNQIKIFVIIQLFQFILVSFIMYSIFKKFSFKTFGKNE